jgi:putative FmdB family regulatory protein
MPTYEYECTECGKVVELVQPITEPARRRLRKSDPRPCDCDAPVARLIGTGGSIIFKGSGFHQTDYRSESYKKDAKADSDGANGKTAKDGKSESTKPEPTAKKEPTSSSETT